MKKNSAKALMAVIVLLITVIVAMTLTACDGTKNIFAPLVQEAYSDLPDGSGIKEYTSVWSETDGYTLEMNADGKVVCTDNDYVICMEKQAGEDFVVLNLADVQLGSVEIEWRASFLEVAEKTIAKLIEEVQPDLITMSGDQGYGEELAFKTVYEYVDSFGIPWAPVYGNHDNQAEEISCAGQAERLQTMYKNCLFKVGPDNLATVANGEPAYGNYIINVVEKSDGGFNVVKSIFMINSGNNCIYDAEEYADEKPVNDDNYAHLSESQIAWYKWGVKGVQKYGYDGKVSSMIVLHIPIYAYNEAFAAAANTDIDMYDYEAMWEYASSISIEQGMEDDSIWTEDYKDSYGVRHEGCFSAPYDDHVMDAILDYDDDASTEYVSTDLVIAGHDHVNCSVNKYKGVYLAYALKTGSGCYWESDMSGGSVITFGSDGMSEIHHEFYDPNVPYLPRWAIWMISIACVAIVLVAIIVPITLTKKKGKSKK